MKKLIVIALLMLGASLSAQVRIGEKDALSTAERFLKENSKESNTALTLKEVVNSRITGTPNLFVFTKEPQGFVVVSARNEVMAYSLTSELPALDSGPFAYWLDIYDNRTDYLFEHPECEKKVVRASQEVEPLLTSCWGQGCFHNEACPVIADGPCGHASAGCVAVAMAQIMYYHNYPVAGCYANSNTQLTYGDIWADSDDSVYHWELMVDTLHESNPSVATLVHHCGLSVGMNYGAHFSSTGNNAVVYALIEYFSYPDVKLIYRKNVGDEEWIAMMKTDLDKHLPIYYSGGSDLGYHAFVCDGYDNNGLFHFNFGWDGVADGYYAVDDPYGFTKSQLMIHVSPFMPIINMSKEICEGSSYDFFGSFLHEAGHYTKVHDRKIYELDLAIKPLPDLHCSNDTTIAYGSRVMLSASGADSYLWSTGDTTATIWVSPEKEQYYFVTGYNRNGCHVDARVKVYLDTTKRLMLYPNPANDRVTVDMYEIDEVELYDLFGKCLVHVDANRHAVALDLSQYPSGVYIVVVKQLKNLYHEKLFVSR